MPRNTLNDDDLVLVAQMLLDRDDMKTEHSVLVELIERLDCRRKKIFNQLRHVDNHKIASKFGCSHDTVAAIDRGERYCEPLSRLLPEFLTRKIL